MDRNKDKERLAVLENQMKWMTAVAERVEIKLDHLIEANSFFKGKVFGASAFVAIVASLFIEWVRR